MAVSLNNGTIVNECDANTGFNQGSVNGDIFAETTGSIGVKTSQTTNDFYTTSITSGPYNFSATGSHGGYHIILWLNVLGAPDVTDGGRILVGNGTNVSAWYVPFPTGYTGGFQPRVINTASDFDETVAGSWSLTGNPGQLSNVTQVGGGLDVTSKVTGNFINVGVDIITIGTGLRIDAGSPGNDNTFETLRAADEGGTIWGWMTSFAGAFISRGGIYIGPATGGSGSKFSDTGKVVIFKNERVANGFYDINVSGSGTDFDLNGCVILAENAASASTARWSFTIDGTRIPSADVQGGLMAGFRTITLRSTSSFVDVTLDDGTSIVQNGGTLDGCTITDANTITGTALIRASDIENIFDCTFNATPSAGHAIELTGNHPDASASEINFSGNTFINYQGAEGSNLSSSSGSPNAALFNNSGKDLIINIVGGGTSPSVRNGANATTVINNNVTVTVTIVNQAGIAIPGVEVAIFQDNVSRTVLQASIPTDENGQVVTSAAASTGAIIIRARQNANIADFQTTSGIDEGAETITTDEDHHFQDGDAVIYDNNGGTASVGLTNGNTYYVNNINDTTLSLHNNAADAIADASRVDLSQDGSETHSLDPVRYVPATATGTIGLDAFSAQITMITDAIAQG